VVARLDLFAVRVKVRMDCIHGGLVEALGHPPEYQFHPRVGRLRQQTWSPKDFVLAYIYMAGEHDGRTASFLRAEYGIKPYESWGAMEGDETLKKWWDDHNGNEIFKQLDVTVYLDSWSGIPTAEELLGVNTVCWAFASLTEDGLLSWDRERSRKFLAQAPAVETLLSIGGWGSAKEIHHCLTWEKTRTAAVNSCLEALDTYGFDGIDMDWEYPTDAQDRKALLDFFRELRRRAPASTVLTLAASSDPFSLTPASPTEAFQVAEFAQLVDRCYVMTYDYAGPWNSQSGHNSGAIDGEQSILKYIRAGWPASKLAIGCAWYGRRCTVEKEGGTGGRGQNAWGWEDLTYGNVFDLVSSTSSYEEHYDTEADAPWNFDPLTNRFITCETPRTIHSKKAWAHKHGLGGIFAWAWNQDTRGILRRALID
jgi:GH18 family chitinase